MIRLLHVFVSRSRKSATASFPPCNSVKQIVNVGTINSAWCQLLRYPPVPRPCYIECPYDARF